MDRLTKPSLQHVTGHTYVVKSPLTYRALDKRVFTVPVGFQTDGASVPRFLWMLYPPFGDDYSSAAVLHDYLYAKAEEYTGKDWNEALQRSQLSRKEADDLFREVMVIEGFRRTGRWMIYRSVRAGGWKSWRRYRKEVAHGNSLEATG